MCQIYYLYDSTWVRTKLPLQAMPGVYEWCIIGNIEALYLTCTVWCIGQSIKLERSYINTLYYVCKLFYIDYFREQLVGKLKLLFCTRWPDVSCSHLVAWPVPSRVRSLGCCSLETEEERRETERGMFIWQSAGRQPSPCSLYDCFFFSFLCLWRKKKEKESKTFRPPSPRTDKLSQERVLRLEPGGATGLPLADGDATRSGGGFLIWPPDFSVFEKWVKRRPAETAEGSDWRGERMTPTGAALLTSPLWSHSSLAGFIHPPRAVRRLIPEDLIPSRSASRVTRAKLITSWESLRNLEPIMGCGCPPTCDQF